MLLLLVLPILIAGFLACHIHPYYSYKLHRYEGQYLYLKSAELGVKCFCIAFITATALHYWVPDIITLGCSDFDIALSEHLKLFMKVMGAKDSSEEAKYSWFLILSVLTFLSSFVLKTWGHITLCSRFRVLDTKIYVIGELLRDSPLDDLLFKLSLQKDKHVMLTMDDKKVYVGKVISLGEPTETNGMDQDISIMPIMSGYRDKETLEVEFTTQYSDAGVDLYVSLRQESIVSATEFDFKAYKAWNKNNVLEEQ